ncbi:MAG: MaoC/PaaZ C-terminal domain-containing protein [Firmicutes bacterium]|nr:MaoC/PaaZ C-terminal domain-containing protein [Bacillota bacterium]
MTVDWHKGKELPVLTRGPVTRLDLVRYAGASGDFNPIHTVEEFAIEAGLGGVIAHGMLTMAYVGQLISDFAGPDSDIEEFGVRFRAMVRPGDVIICRGVVQEVMTQEVDVTRAKLQVTAENNRGETVVKGSARLRHVAAPNR